MASPTTTTAQLDHFFSTSAARLDRWRELNAKAQTWAAGARSGKPRGGRAAVEAALAEVHALEDFFAYPGPRLMKALAERIAATTRSASRRLVRRHERRAALGQLSLRQRRMGDGRRCRPTPRRTGCRPRSSGGETHRPYFETLFVTPAPAASLREDRAGDPPPAARR